MRITQVEAIPLGLPLRKGEVKLSYGKLTGFGNFLVKVHTDEGLIGLGDGQSFPRRGTGSQASLVSAINDELAPCLIGQDPLDYNRIYTQMEASISGVYAAKSALDIALHDLAGKILNVPISTLFGGLVRDSLPTELAIDIHDVDATAEQAKQAVRDGYRHIEVKCGSDIETDVRIIAATREAVGGDVQLKIDPNASYTYAQAKSVLKRLEPYRVDLVEQPLPAWDLEGLARLRQEVQPAIILDESAGSVEQIMTAIRLGACDGVHLKPVCVGGLRQTWRAMQMLDAAGLMIIPGTMASSGIGMAAANQLFGTAKRLDRAAPGSSAKYYPDDLVTEQSPIGPTIEILGGPGIGVTLNEETVARYRLA